MCAEGVSDRMRNAESDIRKAHSCHILRQCHAFTVFRDILHSASQIFADQTDGFEVEHIGHFPCGFCGIALDGVGQSVHTRSGCQTLGHRGHHVGVYNGIFGDIVFIHTNELSLFFSVGDDIVDGDFCGSTCGRRNSDGGNGMIFGRRNALK